MNIECYRCFQLKYCVVSDSPHCLGISNDAFNISLLMQSDISCEKLNKIKLSNDDYSRLSEIKTNIIHSGKEKLL